MNAVKAVMVVLDVIVTAIAVAIATNVIVRDVETFAKEYVAAYCVFYVDGVKASNDLLNVSCPNLFYSLISF